MARQMFEQDAQGRPRVVTARLYGSLDPEAG